MTTTNEISDRDLELIHNQPDRLHRFSERSRNKAVEVRGYANDLARDMAYFEYRMYNEPLTPTDREKLVRSLANAIRSYISILERVADDTSEMKLPEMEEASA